MRETTRVQIDPAPPEAKERPKCRCQGNCTGCPCRQKEAAPAEDPSV